ncbi:M48 family metalloprotease [Shimia haliotis]|uniref:Peptidase family M48 n=1 Tax=Shimia haliotis TaxID=1280847 RepID=A0A1I4DLJ7_9RHOB|nr:M48 family metalloprotease [Shimia haliotis]SFK93247.1 Peptidase family M48 [Shimia haliotis]
MKALSRICWPLVVAVGVSGCGTTYEIPSLGDTGTQRAKLLFEEGQQEGARRQLSDAAAQRRFQRVKAKVAPVGKAVCEHAAKDKADAVCDVDLAIDHSLNERNAYFTYKDNAPIIRVTMPLLKDSASDDEVAFVVGHEYGHLIGKHIEKQQQQAMVGALILGSIAVAAGASADYYDPNLVDASVALGAAAGSMAYSQSYELESDTVGTYIVHAAGYDPLDGAKFFARAEDAKTEAGKLSFWGTHPPDEKRVATVLATIERIENDIGLKKAE